MTPAQVFTLTGASVTAGGVELTASTAQGVRRCAAFPRPVLAQVLTVENGGAAPVHCLMLYAAPPLARRLLAGVHVEPHTPEGQAALLALGFAGPYPVPAGVSLAGFEPGAALTDAQALSLAALPEFAECWAVLPSPEGDALALAWANALSAAELGRFTTWARGAAAEVQGTPRGTA